MKHGLLISSFLFLSIFAAGCTSPDRKAGFSDQPKFKNLFSLYEKGNYFKLRSRLQAIQDTKNSDMRFLKAVTYNAFNEPVKSNKIIEQLLDPNSSLPDTLLGELLSLKMSNHLRLYQYRKALNAATAIIKAPDSQTDSTEVASAKTISSLLKVFADAPPQRVSVQKTTTLPMSRDKANLQRIPVQINGTKHHFVLDTGAGFSTIMRSVAKKSGMKIQKVDVKVRSATGMVPADIAVADQVVLGHVKYQNVVFLVFPDTALSFSQINYRIPGIIGFPVIEAAGEIQFVQDSLLKIPANPPVRTAHNLALKGLSPQVLTGIKIVSPNAGPIVADSLVCILDTGAKSTILLAPFFHRYHLKVQQLGRRDTNQYSSAGKAVKVPVYILPRAQFQTGGAHIALKTVAVIATKPSYWGAVSLACSIGQDVLSQFDKIIINFRSMSFLLR